MKMSKSSLQVMVCSIFFSIFIFSGFLGNIFKVESVGYISLGVSLLFFILSVNVKFVKNYLLLLFLIFFVFTVQFFVSEFQFEPFYDFDKTMLLSLIIFYMGFSASFFYSNLHKINLFLKIFVTTAFITLLLFVFNNGLSPTSIGGRLGQGDSNPIWIARLSGLVFIFYFIKIFNRFNLIYLFLLLFLLLVIFLTGSRGPLISLVVTILVFSTLNTQLRFVSILKNSSVLLIPFLFAPFLPSVVFDRLGRLFSNGFDNNDYYRMELLNTAYNVFLEHPLGRGIGSFHLYASHSYPHNMILEILSEMGFIIFIIFIIFIGYVFTQGYILLRKNIKEENFLAISFIYLIGIFSFLNAMFSGDITSPKELYFSLFFIFIYVLGSKYNFTLKG